LSNYFFPTVVAPVAMEATRHRAPSPSALIRLAVSRRPRTSTKQMKTTNRTRRKRTTSRQKVPSCEIKKQIQAIESMNRVNHSYREMSWVL
jgi:hypothetical protein